jgi:YVTN family beta-propeller protein
MVPQNLPALIDGIGGKAATRQRLDQYFTQLNAGPNEPYHWQGNEPTFATPWVYNSAGAPWQTQATVRRIQSTLYTTAPGGEPGNDDLGAMSSWYVWAALGVYPQVAGTPLLSVNSPLFSHIVVRDRLEINAPGAGDSRPYIDGLRVNGHSTTHTSLTLPATGRTRLDFALDGTPNHTWGTGANDGTPAIPPGYVNFPPSTRAFVRTNPAQLRISAGAATPVDVIADNTLGTTPATVTWTATAQTPGITFTPETATVTAAAGSTAQTTLTVTAGPDAHAGFYEVAIAADAGNGAAIPTAHLLITIAHPGEVIPTAYVSNYSDGTVTPVDTDTHTAGPAITVGSGPDGVVVLPDNTEAYVANNNTNDVSVISTVDNSVVTTVPVGPVAADVVATPDSQTVWVSNYGDGTVQPIDTATHSAGPPIKVGANPQRLRLSPDGAQLWVPDQGDGTVSVIDLATRAVTHTVTVGPAPFGVAFGPGHAYVSNTGNGTVSVIDTSTFIPTATINVAAPNGLANTVDGHLVYVAQNGGGVQPIDGATGTLAPAIPFGSGTYAVRFTDDGTSAWAVDSNSNDIQQIDVASGGLGAKVTVGNVPDGIGLTHASGTG